MTCLVVSTAHLPSPNFLYLLSLLKHLVWFEILKMTEFFFSEFLPANAPVIKVCLKINEQKFLEHKNIWVKI